MITEDNKDIIPDLDEFEVLLQRVLSKGVEPQVGDGLMDMDSAYLQMLATGKLSLYPERIILIIRYNLRAH